VSLAQTPLPKTQPNLTLKWLSKLTVSPASVTAGTSITGTVVLLRPAIENLVVGLSLSSSRPIEGNILAADGAVSPGSVTVPKGSDRATFTIGTSNPSGWTGSKTFTLGAAYGSERLSTSFTVTKPVVRR
jgi:hypothetical protein